jgi:hypothetical protein
MGTRHFQKVINKEGETKVAQYGQWDGYPEGQGKEILSYLKTGNLVKYQENLDRIPLINESGEAKLKALADKWKEQYPYMSRDCGSKIHKMIEDGEVQFVAHIDEDEANKWCEGFYTIDFKEGTFTSEYHGQRMVYQLDKLPSEEEYLSDMKKSDPDYEEEQ